jgi:hypothetical protein
MTTTFNLEPAPALAIDALLNSMRPMDPVVQQRRANEQAVLWNLIRYLGARGFTVTAINDGESVTRCADALEVMGLAFDLDECRVVFTGSARRYVVVLIWDNGNDGFDALADWSAPTNDTEGFSSAVEGFLDLIETSSRRTLF